MSLILAAAFLAAQPQPAADTPSPPAALMVFFDSGKAHFRRDSDKALEAAAAAAGAGARLRLVGHTDRPGSEAVNRRMSLARARAVAAALVARGVPGASISTAGEGEDRPYLPTADGVMEIQNRRVDIIVER
ncbi:hypothetical protein GCM10022281_26070 [Sphingomonas rosea]|uniref:OmpA-like domain-containing protein n=1 Tax=Sphingomonas rosea TaxID=335605 RepID=A0ABP7UHT1_9SPHN